MARKIPVNIKKQKGFVTVIMAIAVVAMIGMIGLALDFGHAATNRARLQNSLDAAALGTARTLQLTTDQAAASAAGRRIFTINIQSTENYELFSNGASANDLTIEFSDTVKPFVPSGTATNFVRVRMNSSVSLATWFMSVFGQNNLNINSSAVAGVSPTINYACNLGPFVVCGNTEDGNGPDNNYGYPVTNEDGTPNIITIKQANHQDGDIGPGNFQLVNMDSDDHGGADLRENLAGADSYCVTFGETLETQTGKLTGPTWQGFNTRFEEINEANMDSDLYPPDMVTATGIDYETYRYRYKYGPIDNEDGMPDRRVLSIPIANCDATVNNGHSTLQTYPETLCLFLTEEAGTTGNDAELTAQVIDDCPAQGISGTNTGLGPGIRTIILYGDPDRWDS